MVHKGRRSQRDLDALILLELRCEILHITLIVRTGPLPMEIGYDEFLPRFRNGVDLAKELLTAESSQGPMLTFSVNMGFIPPLLFCSFKCRDWLVRQEALSLLRRSRRQEGIWSTSVTASVLTRVIEIESEGLAPEDVIPELSHIESINVGIPLDASKLCLRYHRSRDAREEARNDPPP